MAMDGNVLLNKLARLSQVSNIKEFPQLTQAMFPGTHCPLMGAAMAVAGMKNSLLVVVGTDECSYYTKSFTIGSAAYGGLDGRCVSVVLDNHDVTFGSTKKMHDAFKEIMEEYQPDCIFLVTTCVVEIIGDDYDAIADELSAAYKIPVLAVHTEHFKAEDHFPGIERTVTACLDIMERQNVDGRVNVLGQRMGNFATTELSAVLRNAGVQIGVQLPSGCSVDEIKAAPAAKVNIVLHELALPLAKAMQNKFGTPYVHFDKYVDPDKIYASYQALFAYLEMTLPDEVTAKYRAAQGMVQGAKAEFQGKNITYVYGNTPYSCFEANAFLAKLGLVPLIIQSNRFSENDAAYVEQLLQITDPYVCKAANIAPLHYIYDIIHPHMYLGHEFSERLRQKGIAVLMSDAATGMLGFEVTHFCLGTIMKAAAQAEIYRKEAGL